MNRLIRMLMRLIHRQSTTNAVERYLARSVDAHDFEVRAQALERCRS